jgi:hypothetical protein
MEGILLLSILTRRKVIDGVVFDFFRTQWFDVVQEF